MDVFAEKVGEVKDKYYLKKGTSQANDTPGVLSVPSSENGILLDAMDP